VQFDLVNYEREYMRGLFNKMIEEGTFNKKVYSKKKMDISRKKVHDIDAMTDLDKED
jgi:hypothetical protein